VSVKQLPDGRWLVDTRDVNGRRHRHVYRTKKTAEKAHADALAARERGEAPRPRVTLRQFVASDFTQSVQPSVRRHTWRGYESNLRRHILPRLGDHPLGLAVQRPTIQRWIDTLHREGMRPATIQNVWRTLRVVLNHAADDGLCPRPPRQKALRFPIAPPTRLHVPTVAEIQRLADAIDPRFEAYVLLGGFCAMREGEILGLHPDSIDWGKRRIHVWQTLERAANGHPPRRVDMTKSTRRGDGGQRYVTMPEPVVFALRRHITEWPHPDWVFHHHGHAVEATWLHHHVWAPARIQAGLPDVRFHDLRHAGANIMGTLAGWGPKKVQAEMGHASAGFTLSRYGHVWEEDADADREKLDHALAMALRQAQQQTQEAAQ
jgi:integrase